jgi:hypothetical protein
MAILSTIDGHQITFDPEYVSMLTDHDAGTGAAVTTVYGITTAPVHISEQVGAFLGRLGLADALALLTRPNNSPVWIKGAAVSSRRAPLPDEYVRGVSTVLSVGTMIQGVVGSPASATAALNACGGHL